MASAASILVLAGWALLGGHAMAGGSVTVRARVLPAGPLNAAGEQLVAPERLIQGTPETAILQEPRAASSRQIVSNGVWLRVSEGPGAVGHDGWRISVEYLGN